MNRRKNRRPTSRKPLSVRRSSAIEWLESRQLLTTTPSGYLNLVLASDQSGAAMLTDSQFTSPWGLAVSPGGGPLWAADNTSGDISRFSGSVSGSPFTQKSSLTVTAGAPTAITFNPTSDFTVGSGATSGPALFLIASQNGEIDGWNTLMGASTAQATTVSGADFTGLAVANNGTNSFLYAADFQNAKIDVFNASFQPTTVTPANTTLSTSAFTDSNLPSGYAPYNVQLFNNQLYVTYALQSGVATKTPTAGAGDGAIDVYNLDGSLVQRLVAPGGSLNEPYGLAMAPSSFGDFQGDLLVANGGDGHILAYDSTGAPQGALNAGPGTSSPITIPGVRGLTFGNGATSGAGDVSNLFYSASNNGHGQLGEILNAFDQPLAVIPTTLSAEQGSTLSGTLATLTDSNANLTTSGFSAQINWGDGNSSTPTLVANGNGGFNVQDSHSYATAGVRPVTLTVSDGTKSITAIAEANVVDTSFTATPVTLDATESEAFTGSVGSFTDSSGPGVATDYVANIDWGDGSTSAGTPSLSGGTYGVTGSHTYTQVGSFTVTVAVAERNGTSNTPIGSFASSATVADPNTLTATATTFDATQGTSTNVTVATFTDTNVAATADIFSATIDWGTGEGTSTGAVTGSNGNFTVMGSHAYVANGTLTATVTINDAPGTAAASATSTANVADGNTFTPQAKTVVATEGQSFSGVVATFLDTNSLVRASDFTATIDWGDGSAPGSGSVSAASGTLTVIGTNTYTTSGVSSPITVTVTENAPGTVTATATSTAAIPKQDLTGAGATITATATTASSQQVLATFTPESGNTADQFTASIDWGDGGGFLPGTVSLGGDGTYTVVGSHTYAAPGAFTPDVLVYESTASGTATPAAAFTATANVASPIVLTPMTLTGTEHAATAYTVATFTDNVAGVSAGDFTATIDWGDGTSASVVNATSSGDGVFTVIGTHAYADEGVKAANGSVEGPFTVTVTVTDNPNGFSTSATSTATMAEADNFTSGTATLSTTKGVAFSGPVAVFVDADTTSTAGDFTAVISWDGNTVTAGTVTGSNGHFTVSGSHTYSQDGGFPLSVTIQDDSGLAGAAEKIATANAVVMPGTGFSASSTAITATEGQSFSGAAAFFTDLGSTNPASAFTATINWGDGTSTTGGNVTGSNGNYTVSGGHTYAEEGSFQVTVQIVQTATTASLSATSTANVSDADVLTGTGLTVSATPGVTFTGTVATFTDVSTAATAGDFTATIDWGDGSSTTGGSVTGSNGTFTVSGSHAYSQIGSDVVRVTLSDKTPGTATATATGLASVTTTTTTTATATISGEVFNDFNDDGIFSPGEPGLAGRTVFLNVDGSGQADGTNPQTTTDASGNFTFTGLTAGSYAVMEAVTPNQGVTVTTPTQTVSVTAGQTVSGVEIGNLMTSPVVPMHAVTVPPAASDANTAYIDAIYQVILGHAPDAAGLASWQQQLASGASRASVAQGIWDSAEHRGIQVEQFYQEFLGRASDPQGKAFWTAAFDSWGTDQIEVAGFLSSAEYQNNHSGNTALVDAIYQDIDLRTADSSGESYWVSQLNGGESLVNVLFTFIYGPEASTAVVDAFYAQFLHRAPDAATLQSLVNQLSGKTITADQLAVQILSSDEFFSDVTTAQAPAFTSAHSASFASGTGGTFTVSASGTPVAGISETDTPPAGVSLGTSSGGNATLTVSPAVAAGTYHLNFKAGNGVGTAATQTFTLTIT
ncbi:MAG TPA: TIGR03118 family protein [Pirellulales bacterium]|nr:TIGR03118 family protein [Pirellulales bacterium]